MAAVDDRVVSMQFDNAQFEQRLGETLKGLDQLNKSLDFSNAQRNLGDLSDAGNRFNMGRMGDAVEGVSAKFLGLATVGITALSNITNRAVDAGLAFVKSFTFAPIQQGFSEFGEKVGSIQTILANTARYGTTLPDVNASLDKLSAYADKTIFSFGDMTKNIGLFTNAGIKIEDATSAIQGFSNVAAASGTTAQGAAGAAYQLSQALSSGKVTLMDWRSLTNVGMGNKNMQDNLVQIADKMGTLKAKGIDATTVQKDFNGSLEKGWLSADVMSTYLKIMAGDMDKAKITALGFSGAEADAFLKTQQTAADAATVVRTFPQMMDTIRSTFVTGWSKSFSILFGGFEGSSKIFTDIANSVGGFLGNISKARNELLEGWDKLGGRTELINAFKDAIKAVGAVLGVVKTEFRNFFPAKTAQDLKNMTDTFASFASYLMPTQATLQKLSFIFDGLFSIIDIGWHILKELGYAIANLIGDFRGTGTGALDLASNIGKLILQFDDWIIAGGNLHAFFLKIDHVVDAAAKTIKNFISSVVAVFHEIVDPVEVSNATLRRFGETVDGQKSLVEKLHEAFLKLKAGWEDLGNAAQRIVQFFKDLINPVKVSNKVLADHGETVARQESLLDKVSEALGRVKIRWNELASVGDNLLAFGEGVVHVLEKVLGYLKTWFGELGNRIAEAIQPGDFNAAVDAVNVGLLGGIALMFRKFFKGGAHLDIDLTKGLFDKAGGALDAFKDKMKAVQTELKAKALMEIAIALGVLTASIVVLSLIDSQKLTTAMTALAIGFGQLVVVMKLMDEMASGTKDAAKFAILATGMTLVATAALILSGAVAVLAQLSWEQLSKGLGGVTAMLALMVGTAKLMGDNAKGMLVASIAMIPLATGISILAGAVALFGLMSWEDIAKGMVAIGVGLGVIAGVMQVMPVFSMIAAGIAMVPLATGLAILAGVVKLFSMMSWGDMLQGFVGLGVGLGLIAVAMNLMPITMPLIAWGLLRVAEALAIISGVLVVLGLLKTETLAKGLGAIAGVLIILVGAMQLMQSALLGAATMVIVAGALVILAGVMKTLGDMSLQEIGIALGAIAAVFLVLAIAAMAMEPVLPMLLALGITLGVIGVAFVLFGAGAFLVAKAFQAMAEAGAAGTKAIIESIIMVIKAIPQFIAALVVGLAQGISDILKSADLILRMITQLMLQVLATVIKLVPPIVVAIGAILDGAMTLLISKGPALIETGFQLLMMLLRGLRDHIGEVTSLGVDIVVNFATALSNNVQHLVSAGLDLLFALLKAIADRAGDITAAGSNLLMAFLAGMINNLYRVIDFAVSVIITFAQTIGNEIGRIVDAGVVIVLNLLAGLINNLYRIIDFAVTVMITFAQTIGYETGRIVRAAADLVINFAFTLAQNTWRVAHEGVSIVIAFLDAIGGEGIRLARGAADALIKFLNGLSDAIDEKAPEIRKAAVKLAEAIVGGVTGGLLDPRNVGSVIDAAQNLVKKGFEGAKDWLLSRSPSKRFMQLGQSMAQGVALALDNDTGAENSAVAHAERIVAAFSQTLSSIPNSLEGMGDFNPTITPVLDLTKVKMGAESMGALLAGQTITPNVSFDQARVIATTNDLANQREAAPPVASGPTEVKFEQNIYAPESLSTNDIYRQTRSQFALAKKELNI